MTQIAVSSKGSTAGARWRPQLLVAALALAVAGGGVYLYAGRAFGSGGNAVSFNTLPVRQGPFDVRVNVKGELQAVENIEVTCGVEGTSTITQIVDEGSFVHKGDILAVLDSSAIRQKLEDAQIELERATADVTTAEEMLEIQKSQNAANLEAAQVALQLAQIDLTSYVEGTYPSLVADAKMMLEKAQTGLKTAQDDLAQTRSLFSKGFVTATEVKNKELAVSAAQRDVAKAENDQNVLVKYSHDADLTAKKSTLAQAEQKLSRTKRENAANLSQKQADLRAKQQQLGVISRRVERFKEQVANCTINAPADGLVVYQNNSRDRAEIQEGAQVRERQTLMKLPDTSRMKLVFKANENQVTQLAVGQTATINLSSGERNLTGRVTKISPVSDSTNRWMNPDQKEYPVDVVLDHTPKGLKPGMTGELTILVDHVDNTLAIPMAALYTAGTDRYAFVATPEGAVPSKLKIGRLNEQDVEVVKGLQAEQRVVLLQPGQGKTLLARAGIEVKDEPQRSSGRRRDKGEKGPKSPTTAPAASASAAPAAEAAAAAPSADTAAVQ